jgi:hypothetical protein
MSNGVRRYYKNLLITSSQPLLTAQTGIDKKGEDGEVDFTTASNYADSRQTHYSDAVFQADVVFEETYELTNEISVDVGQYDLNKQSKSDVVFAKRLPFTLTIEGGVSSDDTSLLGSAFRNIQRAGQVVGDVQSLFSSEDDDRAVSGSIPAVAFRNLSVFADQLIPCRVTAGFQTYSNMLITSVKVTRDRSNTNSLIFRIALKQLRQKTIPVNVASLGEKGYELETGWEFLGARDISQGKKVAGELKESESGPIMKNLGKASEGAKDFLSGVDIGL